MQKMLSEANSAKEKAYLLQSYLDEFRGGFYRQTSFADFEMQAHAVVESGRALTKDSLNNLYASIFDKYYGNAVYANPVNASEWSRIPHFLRTDNFYVYQYATSFAAATALAKNILKGGEEATFGIARAKGLEAASRVDSASHRAGRRSRASSARSRRSRRWRCRRRPSRRRRRRKRRCR